MQNELSVCPITLQQDLLWSDMDAYQHVNNAVYFRYFEDARMAYFEKIGVNTYMAEHQVGPILAATSADFFMASRSQLAASAKGIGLIVL